MSERHTQQNPILVTGASGNVGREVVSNLLAMGQPVRAAALDEVDARRIPGQDTPTVLFDFGNPDTYQPAFDGVDRLFLMRPPAISDVDRFIKPVIDYAVTHGVGHIVFLSIVGAEGNKFVPHYKIEQLLAASGIPTTLLRAGFFMQNLDTTHRADIRDRDDLFIPAGKGKTAFIDARDLGAIAAKALSEPGHDGKIYTLTGSEALDCGEVAEIMTEVLGRPIRYSNPSLLSFARHMKRQGHPLSYIGVVSAIYTTTRFGAAERITQDAPELLGRPPIALRQYIEDYADVWRARQPGP
jgi:uncharacterized protein YbjT (DUF2867 family)